jgi:hypothetical protein
MKRIAGGVLMLAGAVSLYYFAARAMYFSRDALGTAFDPGLPLNLLGRNYPCDVLLLLGAAWGLLFGFATVFTADPAADAKGGRVARAMLLNAFLLVSSLFVAYVGGKTRQDPSVVAAFGITALAQVAVGLLLLILSIFEKPKGVASLIVGGAVYLFGVAVGVLAFLQGGGD